MGHIGLIIHLLTIDPNFLAHQVVNLPPFQSKRYYDFVSTFYQKNSFNFLLMVFVQRFVLFFLSCLTFWLAALLPQIESSH